MAAMVDEQPPDIPRRSLADRAAGRIRREREALLPLVAEARSTPRAKQARRALTKARLTAARLAHSPDAQLDRIAERAVRAAHRDTPARGIDR